MSASINATISRRHKMYLPAHVWPVLVSIAAIGAALAFAITEETPMGALRGRVTAVENGVPIAHADVTLTSVGNSESGNHYRRAVSGDDGTFTIQNVPAGSYQVTASTRAHTVQDAFVFIQEGRASDVALAMSRSMPMLGMMQHQRIFGTRETAQVPVQGYVDGKSPRGSEKLSMSLYKTRLSTILSDEPSNEALQKMGAYVGEGADRKYQALPTTLVKPAGRPAPSLIAKAELPITEADREGFFFKRVQFGKLDPGLYLTEIRRGEHVLSTWMLVTDTALVVKRAQRQLVAYAVDMKLGTPLPGTAVRCFRSGAVVAQGTTGSDGTATIDVPPATGSQELTTVAIRGQDEATVHRNEYDNSEQSGTFRAHVYTDRPIYRPGQTVLFKGIVRRAVQPGSQYAVPAGQPVKIVVHDARDEKVLEQSAQTNAFGSYSGSAALSPEAPTGVYTILTTVGGETMTSDFVVASYKKPEFQLKIEPAKKRWLRGEMVEMNVSAEYYFGAPVAGAAVHYYIDVSPDWASLYPEDYEFDAEEDHGYDQGYQWRSQDEYLGETKESGDLRLDENGRAVIRFRAVGDYSPGAPQDFVYTVSATAKDEAEREVQSTAEARVSAGDFRLVVQPDGYVAEPGKPAQVTIMVRSHEGMPVPNVPVTVDAGYPRWKDGEEKFNGFLSQPLVTGPDGRASLMITPPHSGEVRINATASDSQRRIMRGRADIWASGNEGGDLQTEYGDLSLMTDHRRYQPGETARVMVNSARLGQTVLLCAEGDRVYKTWSVPMTKHSVVTTVPVLAEYGPNVILTASYVRDKHFASSQTPLRVTVPKRDVKVSVTPDRVPGPNPGAKPTYGPGDLIRYSVDTRDASGKGVPSELSFAVVDESIFALREDNPTALTEVFYPRRYSSVSTEYSFAVEYLGDADKAEPKITARKKFPDTAYWNPTLTTDAAGHAKVEFRLPDNLTTWRATAVAQTKVTAFGRGTTKVIASKPFLLRLEPPRFLTQRDQSTLRAVVHNDTGASQTAIVRARTEGVTLSGDATQTLTIPSGAAQTVQWTVTAGEVTTARLDVSAWTPKTAGSPQYTDRVELSIPVRTRGRDELLSFSGELAGAESTEVFRLDPAASPAQSRLLVRITPSVASSMTGALDYLVGYPYGCTEQTMSRFLPDLIALRAEKAAGRSLVSATSRSKLSDMVRDGIARITSLQHSSGAWGWWEHDPDDAWMTAYVLYGLATAKANGYRVSDSLINRGVKGGIELAKRAGDEQTAFLLYSLALTGNPDAVQTAGILRQTIHLERLGPEALSYVVLVDRHQGRQSPDALRRLEEKAITEGAMTHWTKSGQDTESWDDRMVTSAVLRALLAGRPQSPLIASSVRWLMTRRTGGYWQDTRDTSCVVSALCDYLESKPQEAAASGDVRVLVNGRPGGVVTLSEGRPEESVIRVPAALITAGKNEVKLVREGGSGASLFYTVEARQTVVSEDMAALTPAKITVKREYLRLVPKKSGDGYWSLQAEPTNNHLRSGDQVRVRLTIETARPVSYVLIEDAYPAGCEPSERGSADDVTEWGYWWSSVDVRDDRIAFFARRLEKGKHVIEYNLRAQLAGQYHVLPTMVQAMYAPELRGYSAESRLEVR